MKRILPCLLALCLIGDVSAVEFFARPKKAAPAVASISAPASPVKLYGEDPPAPPVNPPAPFVGPTVPTVSLPAALTVRQGRKLVITATTNCSAVSEWDAPDTAASGNLNLEPLADRGKPLSCKVDSIVPGTYPVRAIVALDGVGAISNVCLVTVTPATIGPPQPPTPGPVPPTPPVPGPINTATSLWIFTIDNISGRAQPAAMALGDPILWNRSTPPIAGSLKAQGHDWRQYQIGSSDAAAFSKMLAAAGGQSCIVVLNAQTKVWLNTAPADLAIPGTAAGVQALVNKFTGK